MNTFEFLQIPSYSVPDREVFVQGDTRLTYMEAVDQANRLATVLQNMGVTKGGYVAAMAVNSPAYVITYFACSKLGATFVPLNYRAKEEELTYMVNTAAAQVMFVGDRYVDLLKRVRPTLTSVREVICYDGPRDGMHGYQALVEATEPEDIFTDVEDEDPNILIYTSGTTSLPKGVVLTTGGMSEYVLTAVEMANPEDPTFDVQVVSVPFFHIAGATQMMLAPYAGRKLVILGQFSEIGWLEAVQNEKATLSFLVPTMLKRIMDLPEFGKYDLSSLKSITYGAAPMPYEVVRRAVEVFDCDLNNAYGQTESNSTLTFLGPDDHRIKGLEGAELELKLKRLRSVGRPRDDVAIFIMDSQDNILPPNAEGEICVASSRVMKGYFGNEEATQDAIHDGILHTGDVGYLDDENYLFITGRKKDLIIRGGENISTGEIEAVLMDHSAIADAAVIGVYDVEWGEEVKAVLVAAPGVEKPSKDELVAYAKGRLASYKAPKYVAWVDELPLNPMGKVLKTDLRKDHGGPDDL